MLESPTCLWIGRKVHERVVPDCGALQGIEVEGIADHEPRGRVREVFAAPDGQVVEDGHGLARAEALHEMASDEACAAHDESCHGRVDTTAQSPRARRLGRRAGRCNP